MRIKAAATVALVLVSTFACQANDRTPLAPSAAARRGPSGASFALTPPASGIVVQDMTQGITADSLARALVGPGVAISNVTYTGAPGAAAMFASDSLTLGMTSGIILSTGAADSVIGPNKENGITTDWGLPGDAQLSTLIGGTRTFDASILQFDFVPDSSTIYVARYVFASDEYNEFVNSGFNDVMAFYVNGTNCALVGGQPVSINVINNGYPYNTDPRSNPQLYRNNALPDGGGSINTEMDGLTRVLTCTARVSKGVVNHLKLAIADANDGLFDSNVFIGAGALTTIPPVPVPYPTARATWSISQLQCNPPGAVVALDGTGSSESGGSIVSYAWMYGASVIGTGATFSRQFAPGTTPLSLVVTDANGATATTYFSIVVPPPPPPATTISATPNSLWPPDHKYVDIAVSATAAAATCGGTVVLGGYVVSNQPDNVKGKGVDEGDGNTTGDIKVTRPDGTVLLSSNAQPRVPFNPLTDKLQLRAERAGTDSERVYTIVLTVNGFAADSATVVVGHDQGTNGQSGPSPDVGGPTGSGKGRGKHNG
ncbi:MAG: choice-of-anchor L domain-containing protein [Gemmatimonadaceae bacterium]